MSTPLLEYEPVQAVRKRRDYFGIASLPFAMIHLALLFMVRQHIIHNGREFDAMIIVRLCFIISGLCAAVGVFLMRGKSIAGLLTFVSYVIAAAF